MIVPQKIFLICRAVDDGPMKPEYVGGFHCRGCGKEVAVSPEGRQQIAAVGMANVLLFCNPCGGKVVELIPAAMKANPQASVTLQFNPDAVEKIEHIEGKYALEIYPQAEVTFDPLHALRNPKGE